MWEPIRGIYHRDEFTGEVLTPFGWRESEPPADEREADEFYDYDDDEPDNGKDDE